MLSFLFVLLFASVIPGFARYTETTHRELREGEVPVSVELEEYSFMNRLRNEKAPYRVIVDDEEKVVRLDKNTEIEITAQEVTSVKDILRPQNCILVPNPVQDKLDIEFQNNRERDIIISDTNHKICSATTTGNKQVSVDMSSFAAGIYFVRIVEEGNTYSKKIIKQ